tara:strand:+ start:1880 stop:2671 length:792 start_codon:yes stop_codon:yes gene_type:complete
MSFQEKNLGREYLGNRLLFGLIISAFVFLVIYFSLYTFLPTSWQTPGSLPLYVMGLLGTLLLLVSILFIFAKRTVHLGLPPVWLMAHVVAAILGMVLVAVHTAGKLTQPPALIFIPLIGLSFVGVLARLTVSDKMSSTFGSRYQNFGDIDEYRKIVLRQIISKKKELLLRVYPNASEGTFSLQLLDWCLKPGFAFSYARLEREENRFIGARRALPLIQAYWRWIHIVLALLFFIGLVSHVFTVTFLAEYIAEGREIIWPHFSF